MALRGSEAILQLRGGCVLSLHSAPTMAFVHSAPIPHGAAKWVCRGFGAVEEELSPWQCWC